MVMISTYHSAIDTDSNPGAPDLESFEVNRTAE